MKDALLQEAPAVPVPNNNFDGPPWMNPATPQFPPGTMWALVRRALLADTKGLPVASPLVESVQVRVYVTLEAQTFFEWETRHALLLGKGGFHLTKPEDQGYAIFPLGSERALKGNLTAMLCQGCHPQPGIFSINTRSPFWQDPRDRLPQFRAVSRARMDEIAAKKAEALPAWTSLRKRWDDPAPR